MHSLLIAATENATVPPGLSGWQVPLTISIACLLVLFIASRTIEKPHVGPKMPLGPLSPLLNDISVPAFIGSMCFGHILGVLAVLGFSNLNT